MLMYFKNEPYMFFRNISLMVTKQIPTLNAEHMFMISCWFMHPSILIHRFMAVQFAVRETNIYSHQ